METKQRSLTWNSLFLVTFLASYLYVFNEWLFTVTKPSFMNDLGLIPQLQIFFTGGALLASLCFLGLLPLWLLGQLPVLKPHKNRLITLGAWLPAAVFAALALILVDNFTYTVFKIGVITTEGWSRGLYALGFTMVTLLCNRSTLSMLVNLDRQSRAWGVTPKWTFSLMAVLLLLPLSFLVSPHRPRVSTLSVDSTVAPAQRPHILLVTADGVNATNTSLYGYSRDTTPQLVELAESSLVAENVFANSDHSTGSIISLYTSKHPDETRLFFAHNTLKGDDAYEHLPGILRSGGYRTVQIAVPYYLEPRNVNLLDGFDEVRLTPNIHSTYLNKMSKFLPSDKALFIDETMSRLLGRIRHIFFIQVMNNPRLLAQSDIERWEILRQEIQNSREPLFVHIHLVVTHGKRFNPVEQKYSAGRSIVGQEPWNVDFYDDSILDFDKNVGDLLSYLTDLGLLENTLLIIGSDHSQQWLQHNRIPLLIRFPHGAHAGRITTNVQNLDIAPTILDYIGLQQPDWMRGTSLIAGEMEQRLIFSVAGVFDGQDADTSRTVAPTPVTSAVDGILNVTIIYCRKWFRLDLRKMSWETGDVEGSTTTCAAGSDVTNEQVLQWMTEHLKKNGFDVSALDRAQPWAD